MNGKREKKMRIEIENEVAEGAYDRVLTKK